ncbi:MAG: hypothetical protein E6R04_07075 [Spirochaetes bacterium]|nr:MAG: hypothetical protein E6R04_07075 [Spirochaetota bacterium]
MVKIEREIPTIFTHGSERCCLCEKVTPFWTKIDGRDGTEQVPLCETCAPNAEIEDIPANRLAWAQKLGRAHHYPKWSPWKP